MEYIPEPKKISSSSTLGDLPSPNRSRLFKPGDVSRRCSKDPAERRGQIASEVEEFLARGGKIETVPTLDAEPESPMTRKEYLARMKRRDAATRGNIYWRRQRG